MGARYDNIGGVQHKVSKRYDNINGVFRPVSKRFSNIAGVWRQGYSKAIAWTYAIEQWYCTANVHDYTVRGSTDATSENMEKYLHVTYTLSEPLTMPAGSTISINVNEIAYPAKVTIYVNGVSIYANTNGNPAAVSISYTGTINSIRADLTYGNTKNTMHTSCNVTINPAGSNSFLLNDANSADL